MSFDSHLDCSDLECYGMLEKEIVSSIKKNDLLLFYHYVKGYEFKDVKINGKLELMIEN